MLLAKLTPPERKLIRKVAQLQLDSLLSLLNDETEDDLTTHCLQNEIDLDDLKNEFRREMKTWKRVYKKPRYITALDPDNLSIAKTLVSKYFSKPKYDVGRKALWKKFTALNFAPEYPPMPN